MEIIIARHADPNYAIDGLTERGEKEAALLTKRLMTKNITDVYCSPLGRAKLTAKPFLEASGLDCTYYDWLQEFYVSLYQEMAMPDMPGLPDRCCPWDADARFFMEDQKRLSGPDWHENPAYSHKDMGDYSKHVTSSFDALLEKHGLRKNGAIYEPVDGPAFFKSRAWNETKIVIFCHMGLGSLLLSHMLNVPPPVFWQTVRFMPASISVIRFEKRPQEYAAARIFSIGDTGHLLPLGLSYRG